jgi:cold shock CspA family protein
MVTRTVKWFNDSKGYGFITPSEAAKTFSRIHRIQMAGFKTPGRPEGGIRGEARSRDCRPNIKPI